MLKKEGLVRLEDQALDNVSGGGGDTGIGRNYDKDEYEKAGVIVRDDGFFVQFSDKSIVQVNKSVANSMVDCLGLSGQKLSDDNISELIKQCK